LRKVLRKIFGPKREEKRSWRKMHNDELKARILHQLLLGRLNQGG